MAQLIDPHGGTLADLMLDETGAAEGKSASRDWPSWDLTDRQLCDLELLLNGGFSPLQGFLGEADYERVRDEMRLVDGTLWPIPVVLDVPEAVAEGLQPGSSTLALRDPEGVMLAALHVSDVYRPDLSAEAKAVYGTTDPDHPGVGYLLRSTNPVYVGGRLEGFAAPHHSDFASLRKTPGELRAELEASDADRVVAFQTRNPMHRAHAELTLRAAEEVGGRLLVHPVVGLTKPGDVDHYTRVRCYEALLGNYPEGTATLSLLPLAMRMAGPREAVWHAIIRKNHGCTHLIVGRDHAGPGSDASGEPFYGPYEAQELLEQYTDELGVGMVPFRLMVYVPDRDTYEPIDEVPEGTTTLSISGTELRQLLTSGQEIPSWFTYPEVAQELRRSYPPRVQQGFTVFFTGLSGSGKSTIANALLAKMLQEGSRSVTLLDGDLVRKNLSSELGFSKEHRDLNIRRIGWVASEISKHGGVAICAPIAPYDETRKAVRGMVETQGGFVLVHVATPVEVCEERDRKGLYAKARAGIIKEFTGISDPYEEPADAELRFDTLGADADEIAESVLGWLRGEGYLPPVG